MINNLVVHYSFKKFANDTEETDGSILSFSLVFQKAIKTKWKNKRGVYNDEKNLKACLFILGICS